MFADNFHFALQEAMSMLVVAVLLQFEPKRGAFLHPAIEALQGRGGLASRAVKERQFYLGIRTDNERLFSEILILFFFHMIDFLIINYL